LRINLQQNLKSDSNNTSGIISRIKELTLSDFDNEIISPTKTEGAIPLRRKPTLKRKDHKKDKGICSIPETQTSKICLVNLNVKSKCLFDKKKRMQHANSSTM